MQAQLYDPFKKSIAGVLRQMSGIELRTTEVFHPETEDIESYGVSSIISFSGKIKGRLLLDIEQSLALEIAKNIVGQEFSSEKEYMVLAAISELNNIVAGDAITALNNMHSLSLRLAPPVVFAGKGAAICIPKLNSYSMYCTSEYGKLRLNAAFERGL
ncbi:MAG: chemotaxis protein CheX [Clostridia bacterium]|nr:chemotaxis protein CheX [Clostridia bacterium]